MSANLLEDFNKDIPPVDDHAEESWEETLRRPKEARHKDERVDVRRLAQFLNKEEPAKKYRLVFNSQSESVRLVTREEERFRRLADQWRRETGHISLTFKRAMHPTYQQIIGMGKDALPYILRDLQERPTGHWFWALNAISGENPAQLEEGIDSAIQAWLRWGNERRYL